MANKSVGKFFLKLFAIIISVSIVIGVLNSFYKKGYYYNDTYGEIENMRNVPSDLQMINLGTSHGLASFRYSDNGIKCYNLALSGEDIYHDFQTLKQFSNNLSKGCIVALVTSYFSFCMSTEVPSQKRYYIYLDKDKIRDFSYETLISAKYVPVLKSGEYIIKDLIKDQEMDVGAQMVGKADALSTDESTNQAQTNNGVTENIQKDLELKTHAAGRAESWRSGYMINGKRFIEENTGILEEMVEYCFDNGFKPILVSTPIYYALNEEFTDEELNVCYYDNLKAVQQKTGVPYLDLSHDEELSYECNYYDNSDHLNGNGADAFLKKYNEYLKEIGYIQ